MRVAARCLGVLQIEQHAQVHYCHDDQQCASAHGLPVALPRAMMQVESGGDLSAWNPEPTYRYLWDVKRVRPFRELTAARAPVPFHPLTPSRNVTP